MKASRRKPGPARNPDTVFLFGLCIFAGFAQVAAGTPPGSVEDLLPTWAALLWAAALVLAGIVVLVGTLHKNAERGERIELVGRAVFGPFALSYAVAIYAAQTSPGVALLAAAPFVGFGIACLWRGAQIIRRIQQAVRSTRGRM